MMRASFVHLLVAGSTEEQIASWVPAPLLVVALLFVCGLLWALVRKVVNDNAKEQEKRDAAAAKEKAELKAELQSINRMLTELDKRFVSSASLEQLSRMGDRFDARITSVEREQAVLKDRMERDRK